MFSPGDVVLLRCGGPLMVVDEAYPPPAFPRVGAIYSCLWMGPDDEVLSADFKEAVLVLHQWPPMTATAPTETPS